jgi:hypothetical protein
MGTDEVLCKMNETAQRHNKVAQLWLHWMHCGHADRPIKVNVYARNDNRQTSDFAGSKKTSLM